MVLHLQGMEFHQEIVLMWIMLLTKWDIKWELDILLLMEELDRQEKIIL